MTHFPERKKERRKPDLINATTAFFLGEGGGGEVGQFLLIFPFCLNTHSST